MMPQVWTATNSSRRELAVLASAALALTHLEMLFGVISEVKLELISKGQGMLMIYLKNSSNSSQ